MREGERGWSQARLGSCRLVVVSHWIWTIFNKIFLWIDKSDFMHEESPGFQLTGGHAVDLSQKERGKRREEEKERGKR